MAKGFVVENGYYEVAVDLFTSVGCVFQYFLGLSQKDSCLFYVTFGSQLDSFVIKLLSFMGVLI